MWRDEVDDSAGNEGAPEDTSTRGKENISECNPMTNSAPQIRTFGDDSWYGKACNMRKYVEQLLAALADKPPCVKPRTPSVGPRHAKWVGFYDHRGHK